MISILNLGMSIPYIDMITPGYEYTEHGYDYTLNWYDYYMGMRIPNMGMIIPFMVYTPYNAFAIRAATRNTTQAGRLRYFATLVVWPTTS